MNFADISYVYELFEYTQGNWNEQTFILAGWKPTLDSLWQYKIAIVQKSERQRTK